MAADPVASTLQPKTSRPALAPHRLRLIAFGTDAVVVAVVFGLALVLDMFAGVSTVVLYVTASVTYVYYLGAAMWLMDGQTAGKAACGLVVRRIDGTPPPHSLGGLLWAFGRHSVGYVVVDVLGLGAMLALVTPRRRCLHDIAFASEVVMVAPTPPRPVSFGTLYREFWERFATQYDEINQRYRWFFFPWKWLTRVALAVAAYLTFLVRPRTGGEPPPDASSAPPAKALSVKGAVAVWTVTTVATGTTIAAVAHASSPDPIKNTSIVLAVETVGQPETAEISVMRADGSQRRQLTHNTAKDAEPDLYADQTIVFTSDRDGNDDIYVMGVDGAHTTPVTDDPAADWCPDWSPDGNRIAFTSNRDGNPEIYLMSADGSDPTSLTVDEAADWCPDWSPDGNRIAFTSNRDGNPEIYVVNVDGSGLARLTSDAGEDTEPAWSTDSRSLAFTSERDSNRNIYIIGADGHGLRRLTDDPAPDERPIWVPDGTKILFWSGRNLSGGGQELYEMSPDGTEQVQLTTLNG